VKFRGILPLTLFSDMTPYGVYRPRRTSKNEKKFFWQKHILIHRPVYKHTVRQKMALNDVFECINMTYKHWNGQQGFMYGPS